MPELEITHYGLICMAGLIAGFVDSMAGGGGIISVPALLAIGLPADLAIGTNKLQSSMGVTMSWINYVRHGLVRLSDMWLPIAITVVGASFGSLTTVSVSSDALGAAVPYILGGILVFMVASPEFGLRATASRLRPVTFALTFGLLIGFYDGFIGPGTGVFWSMAFVGLGGYDFKQATARTKLVNAASNYTALVIFISHDRVVFPLGLVMAGATITGAYLGSTFVTRVPIGIIRKVFLGATALILASLIMKNP